MNECDVMFLWMHQLVQNYNTYILILFMACHHQGDCTHFHIHCVEGMYMMYVCSPLHLLSDVLDEAACSQQINLMEWLQKSVMCHSAHVYTVRVDIIYFNDVCSYVRIW